jgi:hypothetical protein
VRVNRDETGFAVFRILLNQVAPAVEVEFGDEFDQCPPSIRSN